MSSKRTTPGKRNGESGPTEADECDFAYCHETTDVATVTVEGTGTRVLCPEHADRFMFGSWFP